MRYQTNSKGRGLICKPFPFTGPNQRAVHTQNEAERLQLGSWFVGGDSSASRAAVPPTLSAVEQSGAKYCLTVQAYHKFGVPELLTRCQKIKGAGTIWSSNQPKSNKRRQFVPPRVQNKERKQEASVDAAVPPSVCHKTITSDTIVG